MRGRWGRDFRCKRGRDLKRPYGENVLRSNQQTHILSPAGQRAAKGVGPYKWPPRRVKKYWTPKGAIIETAGSSARSAAIAADTHAALATCHRHVAIPADAGTGLFSPRRPHFQNKITTQRVVFLFWSGRRGSNSLPRPWQGRALPDELRPRNGIDYSVSRRCCQPRILHFTVKLPALFPPGRRPLPAFPPFLRSPWAPPPSAGSR